MGNKIRWEIWLDRKYDWIMERSDLGWDWGQEKCRNIVEMLKLTLLDIYGYL
jgi:hypothetical protein